MKSVLAFAALAALSALPTNIVRAQDEAVADAVAVDAGANSEAASTAKDDASRPLTVSVELAGGVVIAGTLADNGQIDIKTAFGEAKIPTSEVAGIRFAAKDDVTTTVIMLNGDSITGATNVREVTVDTEWGQAKINGSAVQSILLVPNLKWNPTQTISGKRWALVDASQQAKPVPGNGQSVPVNQPTNVIQSQGSPVFPR